MSDQGQSEQNTATPENPNQPHRLESTPHRKFCNPEHHKWRPRYYDDSERVRVNGKFLAVVAASEQEAQEIAELLLMDQAVADPISRQEEGGAL